jgi:hypothetical protein
MDVMDGRGKQAAKTAAQQQTKESVSIISHREIEY